MSQHLWPILLAIVAVMDKDGLIAYPRIDDPLQKGSGDRGRRRAAAVQGRSEDRAQSPAAPRRNAAISEPVWRCPKNTDKTA